MNDSFVEISKQQLLQMCDEKMQRLVKEEERIIEKFIQDNIKPERKNWLGKTKPAVTREELIKTLDEERDVMGHRTDTLRYILLNYTYCKKQRTENLRKLTEKGRKIYLSADDHMFLESV